MKQLFYFFIALLAISCTDDNQISVGNQSGTLAEFLGQNGFKTNALDETNLQVICSAEESSNVMRLVKEFYQSRGVAKKGGSNKSAREAEYCQSTNSCSGGETCFTYLCRQGEDLTYYYRTCAPGCNP